MIRVLFVCTGNICRSPMAEGVFRHLVRAAGLEDRFHIDSAGTDDYHEGETPDRRGVKVALARGVSLAGQKARPLCMTDYGSFDYILAMDGGHFREINARAPAGHGAKVEMFMAQEVPDPWHGGESDFENVFDMVMAGGTVLLARMRKEHRL